MKIFKLLAIFIVLLLTVSAASAAHHRSYWENKHNDYKHCKDCRSLDYGCKHCNDDASEEDDQTDDERNDEKDEETDDVCDTSDDPAKNNKEESDSSSEGSSEAPSWINLENNPEAKNPTYSELVSFIKADKTDRKSYVSGSYMCDSFAEDVHNNAEKAGIKAGFVELELSDPDDMQYCNVFNTVDKGTVYIDCTGEARGGVNCDTTVKEVKIGVRYHPVALYPPSERSYYQGTIESFKVYW
jgi:hypothetical protein